MQNDTDTTNGADGSGDITSLSQLKTYLDGWNTLVRATDKAVADADPDTTSAATLARYRQDAARAKVARDHVQDEWDRLTAVLRRVDRAGTGENATSDSDKLDAYEMAKRTVSRHGSNVRTTISALEGATKALSDSLSSADDFLSQVVSSAKYAQSNLAEDAAESQVDAAAKAVMDAEAALAAHMALTSDADNPAVALLDALLEPDMVQGKDNPADDDGQALIDAISATYDVAKSASDDAREVISELTGEGGKIEEIETKLAAKAEYIGNIADEVGMDPMTGEGTGPNGMSRIDMNEMRSMTNAENIATNAENIMTNAGNISMNAAGVMTNAGNIADNAAAIGMNSGAITDLNNRVGSNESAIMRNTGMISDLNDELEVVRAGVAASMALAGMPAINGRGVSIGIGSYDGESAFAVGFQVQGEMASFKVGVTSAGGETGASAGVGFQF